MEAEILSLAAPKDSAQSTDGPAEMTDEAIKAMEDLAKTRAEMLEESGREAKRRAVLANVNIDSIISRFSSQTYGGRSFQLPPDATDGPEVKWRTASELYSLAQKPVNWEIENIYTERAKIVIAGEQKAGKTFLVCHLAVCQAFGIPFLGKWQVKNPGPVILIAGEDDERESARRIHRMCRAYGVLMTDMPLYFWPATGVALNRPYEIRELRKKIDEVKPRLVIADPLARLMVGDENHKDAISSVLSPAARMIEECGTSYCWVHHLGKPSQDTPKSTANRIRGSSDIASWFSFAFFVSGSMDEGKLDLELIQRTKGAAPSKFSVDVVEMRDEAMGTMRLEARVDGQGQPQGDVHDIDEQIDKYADRAFELLRNAGPHGLSKSELGIRMHLSDRLVKVALDRLIRERRTVSMYILDNDQACERQRFCACVSTNDDVPF